MHVINRLYTSKFDFNRREQAPSPTYMLATVPRSGSTYLAIRLWQTGLMGAPMEYVNFKAMTLMLNRLGHVVKEHQLPDEADVYRYWDEVKSLRTSPNGVFGYKMFISNFNDIGKRYPQMLRDIAPDFVIYLTREDVVGQAISYSRAIRTKTWFDRDPRDPPPPPVCYDREHINWCLRSILAQRNNWEQIFALTNVHPIRITYESIQSSEAYVLRKIGEVMGIEIDPATNIGIPMITKQQDECSTEWRSLFEQEEKDSPSLLATE